MTEPILVIDDLSISFFTRAAEIPAVMNFSASVEAGQALGLVGEFGLRQVDGRARGHARPRQERPDHRRLDPVQGARADHDVGGGAAQDPRLGDRDDLPGADGEPEPGDEDRPAADGSAADPRGRQRGGRPRPGAARRRGGAPARPGAHPRQLPAPALRRPAAAHRHRDGADVEAVAPHPRRADDGARRHRRGRHRRSRQGSRPRVRHFDALHQPQPRAGARDLRPDSA